MPEEIIESFSVKRLQVLDESGDLDASLAPALSDEDIKKIYELLILARAYDERARSLQREGRMGTYASILGQEASQVGSAFALDKTDWIFPSFRESGVFIAMGYPLYMLYQAWGGDERGFITPEGLNILPICVPVGTHLPHAVGAAMAAKYMANKYGGHKIAVVTYFGDGGTSKGDFHEAMNMAGVSKAPVVFICQNNQWAISVPREKQSASKTLAQKAFAYGFEGVQVDGNDVFAVYRATSEAVRKAREGGGPTMIECCTYRMGDHTTADDWTRYRTADEVETWKKKDPILRLRLFMEKKGLWSEDYQKEVDEKSKAAIDDAVSRYESVLPIGQEEIFKFTYRELPARLLKQMREASDAGP
jgi:pyruvate dehydrogenase E1 component alpha subunit